MKLPALLLLTLAVLHGCAAPVSSHLSRTAVIATARAIMIECASLLAGASGDRFRYAVDDELRRRGSEARTTPPDCGGR